MKKLQMMRETDLYTALGDLRWRLAQAAAGLKVDEPNPALLHAMADDLDLAAERLDLLRQGLCHQCRLVTVCESLSAVTPAKR